MLGYFVEHTLFLLFVVTRNYFVGHVIALLTHVAKRGGVDGRSGVRQDFAGLQRGNVSPGTSSERNLLDYFQVRLAPYHGTTSEGIKWPECACWNILLSALCSRF